MSDKFQNEINLKYATPVNYVITNEAEDRTFDANAAAVAELCDVVATLIKDLSLMFPDNITHSDS